MPTTRRSTSGKCGSNRCLGKASSGMGCDVFAYDGTGPVNCEALVIASGQNLKRLLQKRGWGRRPFPTEAMTMKLPAKWETEASLSIRTRTPLRRAVAVTFTALFNHSTTCVPTRKGCFSRPHHSFSLHATRKKSVAVCHYTFFSPAFPFLGREDCHFVVDPCS